MNKQEFLEYVASFNPDYASDLGKDFVEQAKKILEEEDESN